MIKEYIVEVKTKEGFIWYPIPKIKVKADYPGQAEEKALQITEKNRGFRRIAIEVSSVKELAIK